MLRDDREGQSSRGSSPHGCITSKTRKDFVHGEDDLSAISAPAHISNISAIYSRTPSTRLSPLLALAKRFLYKLKSPGEAVRPRGVGSCLACFAATIVSMREVLREEAMVNDGGTAVTILYGLCNVSASSFRLHCDLCSSPNSPEQKRANPPCCWFLFA